MSWIELTVIAGLCGLMALFVAAGIHESKEWESFKVEHKCKVVAKIDGEAFNTIGIGADGNASVGVAFTQEKTGWACNDGVTYYK